MNKSLKLLFILVSLCPLLLFAESDEGGMRMYYSTSTSRNGSPTDSSQSTSDGNGNSGSSRKDCGGNMTPVCVNGQCVYQPSPKRPCKGSCNVNGAGVSGGFTYTGTTTADCERLGESGLCYDKQPNEICYCGHPITAKTCAEYYAYSPNNGFGGYVSPKIPEDQCPDAIIAKAKQIKNQEQCEALSYQRPDLDISFMARTDRSSARAPYDDSDVFLGD